MAASTQSPSRVLLVDHDVDALAALAGNLRERGLKVSLANGAQMARDRAKASDYDVLLASQEVAEPGSGSPGVVEVLAGALPTVPPLIVLVDDGATSDTRISRKDIDRLVTRIAELAGTPPDRPRRASFAPTSHSLENAALGDLLVILATERRSGALTISTPKGYGEIRLVDGDIVDAVYTRLEGLKALARMTSARDGTASFSPGAPAIMRRMHVPTRTLVDEARALAARAADARERAGSLVNGTLIASDGANVEGASTIDEHVLARLRVPAAINELIDELPHSDADIFDSVIRLNAKGRIKELGHAARVQLCGPDQLHLVRASAERAKTAGFRGPARLVFAATAAKLAILGHTVLSLADAQAPAEPAPALPIPHSLATLRLGEGVELDVVAVPLVPAYAPLWPMALAGAAVAVRISEGAAQSLEEACGSVGITILDARAVFGVVDESSAVQVASLIRTALEADPRL